MTPTVPDSVIFMVLCQSSLLTLNDVSGWQKNYRETLADSLLDRLKTSQYRRAEDIIDYVTFITRQS